ncbi:NUDIX hydrolase [Pseudooceanicola nanhaiensis]|uniref:NUDIX hydrolase n=1 Tax=Pseudooceanicola nanhaiensis TaxID=375761 RepID=UPI001CD7B995|nr:NUDIX hydrolase [Pseudooceanicola nanhaiensis]MCA0920291.1 NUDIX hydrolase [Pseudooceanicola nanhaiensis]
MINHIWTNFLSPLLVRPARFQSAALCYREGKAGREVLLITSLDTGRWILPKGWPKTGYDAGGTALEEAWEEAGIKPAGPPPVKIGTYRYEKRMRGGVPVPTDVAVFAIQVVKLLDDYPEAGKRKREWVTPEVAAARVDEEGLKKLLSEVPGMALTGRIA